MMDAIAKKMAAIKLLYPSYNNSLEDKYFDASGNEITINMDDVNAKIAEIFPDYAEKRKVEYPTIVDQLDDIYHNGVDGWKATIKITKDKYPKP